MFDRIQRAIRNIEQHRDRSRDKILNGVQNFDSYEFERGFLLGFNTSLDIIRESLKEDDQ